MDNRSVGVFDSGLGGLSFVKEFNSLLPCENVVYLGDTARLPYGTRTPEAILKYTLQDIAFLKRNNVKIIVIACGTVSSTALPAILELTKGSGISETIGGQVRTYMRSLDFSAALAGEGLRLLSGDVPVLGVVDSAARRACELCRNGRIGVLATASTVKSRSYQSAVSLLNSNFECFSVACPLFVPLIENGYINHPATRIIADEYLAPLLQVSVDTIILGCTHYPFLRSLLEDISGLSVKYVDSGRQAAESAAYYLRCHDMLSDSSSGENHFFVTDNEEGFRSIGGMFLGGQGLSSVHRVTVDDF